MELLMFVWPVVSCKLHDATAHVLQMAQKDAGAGYIGACVHTAHDGNLSLACKSLSSPLARLSPHTHQSQIPLLQQMQCSVMAEAFLGFAPHDVGQSIHPENTIFGPWHD